MKQPIQRNSVDPGHVSHRRPSAFNDHHSHYSFIVFKNIQIGFGVRRCCACDNAIHVGKLINFPFIVSLRFGVGVGAFGFHCALEFSTLDC